MAKINMIRLAKVYQKLGLSAAINSTTNPKSSKSLSNNILRYKKERP